jgi:penicillin-binding protein 1C
VRLPFFRPVRRRWIGGLLAVLALGFLLLGPRPLFPDPISTSLHDRRGTLLGAFPATDGQWRLQPSDSVPHRFARCAIAAEDSRFRLHPGVDPLALLRAVRADLRAHRYVQGGSTLTQQVARMARRSHGAAGRRGLFDKLLEALWAVRLEAGLPKDRILSLWAAHAPFGGNVVGLEAAAWRLCGKSPGSLSWGECAALAALPNAPARLSTPDGRAALRVRRDWILARLLRLGDIDSMEWSLARSEPLPGSSRPLPVRAPHLAELVRQLGPGRDWKSEIDAALQEEVARTAAEHLHGLRGIGVHSLSVVVVELPPDGDPAVRAWIGDAAAHAGDTAAVDLVLSPRSTGSTLKPFLYALALDQGRILPKQWLLDVPARWGDFRPTNSDGRFSGMVPADQALARSLNAPWARVLQEMGPGPFLSALRRAGARHLFRSPEAYGPPLVLGGGELSLAELAELYAMLASGGTARALELARSGNERLRIPGPGADQGDIGLPSAHRRFLESFRERAHAGRILSPGASWLALEALRKPGRIEEEIYWKAFSGGRPLAWKTGTSFGQRDAWALGVSPRWVVGVWAGNPGGEGRPGLWASQVAAPLLFRLFPLLSDSGAPGWFARPPDLVRVPVCAETGWRKSPDCDSTAWVLAPPAGLQAPPDRWHRRIHLDSSRSFRVDGRCEEPHRMVEASWLVLPPAADGYLRQAAPGILRPPPPWREGCSPLTAEDGLEILVPQDGARMVLPLDLDGARQRLVVEVRDRRSLPVHCFLDGRDLGLSGPFPTWAIQPTPGNHALLCEDSEGSRARSNFDVDWSTSRPKSPRI